MIKKKKKKLKWLSSISTFEINLTLESMGLDFHIINFISKDKDKWAKRPN